MRSILFLLFAFHFSSQAQSVLIPYLSGEVYGLADESGRVVVTPQYDDVNLYEEVDVIAVKKNGLWGFIDRKGNTIFKNVINVQVPKPNYTRRANGPIIESVFYNHPAMSVKPFQNAKLYKVIDGVTKMIYQFIPLARLTDYKPFVDPNNV